MVYPAEYLLGMKSCILLDFRRFKLFLESHNIVIIIVRRIRIISKLYFNVINEISAVLF